MSWEIAIAKFEPTPAESGDLAEAEELPLGPEAFVKGALASTFPGFEWEGDSGTCESDQAWSLTAEAHPSSEDFEVIQSVTLMIHFGGASERQSNQFLARLKALTRRNRWTAIDAGSGELIG